MHAAVRAYDCNVCSQAWCNASILAALTSQIKVMQKTSQKWTVHCSVSRLSHDLAASELMKAQRARIARSTARACCNRSGDGKARLEGLPIEQICDHR